MDCGRRFYLSLIIVTLTYLFISVPFSQAQMPVNPRSALALTPIQKAYLEKHKKLKFIFSANVPPYNYIKDDVPQGYTIDILRQLSENLDIKLDAGFYGSPKNAEDILADGEADIVGSLAKTVERSEKMLFVGPLFYSEGAIAARHGVPYFRSVEEIKGRTVAVKRNGYIEQVLKDKFADIPRIECDDPYEALGKVYTGEADIALGSYLSFKSILHSNSLPSINVYRFKSRPFFDPLPIYVAVKKDNTVLKSLLESALEKSEWNDLEPAEKLDSNSERNISTVQPLTEEEDHFVKKSGPVSVISYGDLQTLSFYEDGTPQGFSVDVLKLAAKKTGLNLKFISADENYEKSQSLNSSDNDVFLNVDRAVADYGEFIFTDAYSREPWGLLAEKDAPENLSLKGLSGKKLALSSSHSALISALKSNFPEIEIVKGNNSNNCIEMLRRKNVDAVMDLDSVLKHALLRLPENNLINYPILWNKNIPPFEAAFAVKSNNVVLKSILQKGLEKISDTEKNRLRLRWISTPETTEGFLDLSTAEKKYIAENTVITAGVEKDMAPLNFISDNGPSGYAVDYFRLLARRAGFKVKTVENISRLNTIKKLRNHDLDVIPNAVSSAELGKYAAFSMPYLNLELGLASFKNSGLLELQSLAGKKLGAIRGEALTDYISRIYPQIVLVRFDNVADMVAALSSGKVDAVTGFRAVLDYRIKKGGYNNLEVRVLHDGSLLKSGAGRVRLAVSKDKHMLNSILLKSAETITIQDLDLLEEKWLSNNFAGVNAKLPRKVILNDREKKFLAESSPLVFSERRWEPLSVVDDTGNFKGMVADYLNLISEKTGLRFKFSSAESWGEVLKRYEKGIIDVVPDISSADVPGREMLLSQSFLTFPLVIVGRDNSAYINDPSQLNGKRVGVGRGFAGYNYLRNNFPDIELVQTDNVEDGLIILAGGNIDVFVGHAAVVLNKIKNLGLSDLKIVGSTNYTFNHRIGVDPKYAEAVSIINKAISSITEAEHHYIYQKWLNADNKKTIDYSTIWEIGAAAGILILFFMIWNRKLSLLNNKLNKEINRRRRMELVHRSLHKIAMAIMDVGGIQEFYHVIHSCINEFMYADNFFVARYEDGTKELSFPYYVDEHGNNAEYRDFYKVLAEYVIRKEESALIDSDKLKTLFLSDEVEGTPVEFEVWMGVPLIQNNTVLGVIAVESYDKVNRPDEHDLELLVFVSRYIMIALERMALRNQSIKQTEDLADSEASFRALFDSSGDGIILMDLDFNVINANRSALELYGCRGLEEFMSYTVLDLSAERQAFDKSKLELAKKYMLDAYTDNFVEFEWIAKKVDGTVWFASVGLNLVNLKHGPAVQASIRDITETRHMRKELERSISLMSATIESTADGILVLDPLSRPSVWNRRFLELWDISQEILDNGGTDYLDSMVLKVEDPDAFLSKIEEFKQRIDDDSFDEVTLIDGRVLERLSRPQRVGTDVIGRVWSFRDVTAQRMSEAALIESHRRLNDIIEFLPDPTLVIDKEGKVMAWNRAMEEMTGIQKAEMLGKGDYEYALPFYGERRPILIDIVLEDSFEKNALMYDQLTKGAGIHYAEVYTPNAFGGKGAYLWGVSRPLYNSSGEVVGSIECLRDITERRNTELDLERVSNEAEAAVRAKSEFLANMSHEIRTPMNSIIGIGFLLGKTGLDNKQNDYLEKMMSSANSLLNIIDDILDFSKIEAGKMKVEKIEFRVDSVLRNVSDIVAVKAQEKNLEFILHVEPDVPQMLMGDPLRIGQILTNLTNNAIKFTGEGEIEIKVSLREISKQTAGLRFTVRDTGIGLSQEEIGRLFKSFTQADTSTTRKYGGTGLGLAICKTLVELMDGKVSVNSTPGEGSSFYFDVSFELADNQPEFYVPRRFKEARILVMNDNPSVLSSFESILASLNFRIEVAKSQKELEELMVSSVEDNDLFNLALLDWKVGEEKGVEHAKFIRENEVYADLPVVLMVNPGVDSELRGASAQIGIDVVINKPLTCLGFWNVVSGIFERKQTEKNKVDEPQSPFDSLGTISGARVLLVEDSHVNQIVALDLLENAGLRVSVVDNGKKAIEAVYEKDFDLVLMDIQMPEMDGLTAARKIRSDERFSDLPIIAMTAHAMLGDREKSLEAGMNEHLTKPINPSRLYEELLKYISPHSRDTVTVKDELQQEYYDLEFPEIDGLNVKRGLENLAGSRRGYSRVLKSFKEDYADAAKKMNTSLALGEFNEAAALAHSTKGVAGNMGAERLYRAALDIETIIKAQSLEWEEPRVRYENELKILLEGLQKFSDVVIKHNGPVQYNPVTVRRIIAHLFSLLEEGDAMSVEVMEELRQALRGKNVETELDEIGSYLDNYDFDDAAKSLTGLEKVLDL